MKKIIGGAIAAIIGLYGISIFFTSISSVLAGVIPFILLISGCLIVYLKYKDLYSGEESADGHINADPSELHTVTTPPETISALAESEETESKTVESEKPDPEAAEPEEEEPKAVELEKPDPKAVEPEELEPKAVEPEKTDEAIEEEITEAKVDEVVESKSAEPESEETKSSKDSEDESMEANQNLVGNTGSLVFHNPGCQYSKSKKCTVVFDSREVALKEGYKPCGVCKP